jgi:tripartite-type tricarboxylate transporter receptor subunit TctC
MRTVRNIIAAVFLLISMGVFGNAAYAEYPEKPVRVVVPFTPGGSADNIGRLVASYLQKELGQPFIIDNRPGGGANIGHGIVANSPPDGYTLMIATNSLPINQALYKNLPFNATTSFTPIVLIASTVLVIGARTTFPANSMSEVISYAKMHRVTFSSCGIASVHHLTGEHINMLAKINLVHVPYKGCSQALPDVLGGNVDLYINSLPNVLPFIKSGKFKVFAVTSPQRTPSAPEIPTFLEATGIAGISSQGWHSLVGPAGMPKDIVDKLNRAVNKALADPDIKEKMRLQSYDVKGGSSKVLADLIASDIEISSKIIRAGNIQPE